MSTRLVVNIRGANAAGKTTLAREVLSRASATNSFLLCEPCWLQEEADIDALGTNVIPDRVARYSVNQPESA